MVKTKGRITECLGWIKLSIYYDNVNNMTKWKSNRLVHLAVLSSVCAAWCISVYPIYLYCLLINHYQELLSNHSCHRPHLSDHHVNHLSIITTSCSPTSQDHHLLEPEHPPSRTSFSCNSRPPSLQQYNIAPVCVISSTAYNPIFV